MGWHDRLGASEGLGTVNYPPAVGILDRLFGRGRQTETADDDEFDLTVDRSEEIIGRNVALATTLDGARLEKLVNLTADLIEGKLWEGVDGQVLDDEVLVTIAANAAFPILDLDLSVYSRVSAILVRPSANLDRFVHSTAVDGVLGESDAGTIGVAAAHSGPVSISWDAAIAHSRMPSHGSNVVVHEFAHKIDMANGDADGLPPLLGASLERWSNAVDEEFLRDGPGTLDGVLSDYAWTDHAEFFAVLSEVFFCTPSRLRTASPGWWQLLCELYATEPRDPTDLVRRPVGRR